MSKSIFSPTKKEHVHPPTRPTSSWLVKAVLIASPILIVGGTLLWFSRSESPIPEVAATTSEPVVASKPGSRTDAQLHAEVKQAFVQGNYTRAAELGRTLMTRPDQTVAGQFITAKALSHQSDVTEAVQLFRDIPRDHPRYGLAAGISAGELLLFRAHQLSAAAECFQEVLRIDPQHLQAHERLSYIYGIANLTWRALPHRMALLYGGQFGTVHLLMLAVGPIHEEKADSIQGFATAAPNDPLALYAMARLALRTNDAKQATNYLARVIKLHPEWPEPQAGYGALLLELGDWSRFRAWLANLPPEAANHADIWFVKGTAAQKQNDLRGAVRCFAEAVRREPNHQAAHFQLAQSLRNLGEKDRAEPFLRQARLLEDLVVAVKMWQISPEPDESIRKIMRITTDLGFDWETWGWQRQLKQASTANAAPPSNSPSVLAKASLEEVLTTYRLARRSPTALLSFQRDFSDFPIPNLTSSSAAPAVATKAQDFGKIRFENLAHEARIDFAYFNGRHNDPAGELMYESTGGGVAVLDYDQDGWSDIYFTQGCAWPPTPNSTTHRDRLYRNVQGQRFEDVTDHTRILEPAFGQGVTVGDINQDGFPDLYVCNIGANRLFRNNGDGTYTDITEQTGVGGNEWSTSCVLADFNGDAWPDLYVVNYVEGLGMFDRPCHGTDGTSRLCTPYEYQATHDRLYMNLGDGNFRDVSADAGILTANGKGLGIVAADFENTGQLSLFIANDTVPNFFFHNRTAKPGDPPRFNEQGFVTGLAVNWAGQSQASMGVACGDANGDGLLDLLVTNFYQEGSTLYMQHPGLIFSDRTRRSGLYEPSFLQLGFGTQFLDADLDGRPDLIVTNGHVGDISRRGTPYKMPTQVFRNVGDARFAEVPSQQLGKFFEAKHLGRGLARVDWNRDGRDDFVVSHLEEAIGLLTNRTTSENHSVTFQLRGVRSTRDAIGATITITCGKQKLMRQMTAGDGYQASNERRLVFGVGPATRVDKVEVRWPSGTSQEFGDLPVDTDFLLIENLSSPITLPRR